MALGEINVQLSGNLTADPEIRFTPSGTAVAKFRVACTPRRFNRDTNSWEDAETTFLSVEAWRVLAENVAESLKKGTSVLVNGKLRQRSYTSREGEQRTVYEVHDAMVAVDLSWQTADVTKSSTSGGGRPGGSAPAAAAPAAQAAAPAAAAPARPASVIDDPPF